MSGEGSFGCGVAQGGEEERLQRGYAHERELRCFAWGRARSHEEALLARTHAPLLPFAPSPFCPSPFSPRPRPRFYPRILPARSGVPRAFGALDTGW